MFNKSEVNSLFNIKVFSSDQHRVRILTYNVFLRPPGINNNGNDYKNERCEKIIEQLDK